MGKYPAGCWTLALQSWKITEARCYLEPARGLDRVTISHCNCLQLRQGLLIMGEGGKARSLRAERKRRVLELGFKIKFNRNHKDPWFHCPHHCPCWPFVLECPIYQTFSSSAFFLSFFSLTSILFYCSSLCAIKHLNFSPESCHLLSEWS